MVGELPPDLQRVQQDRQISLNVFFQPKLSLKQTARHKGRLISTATSSYFKFRCQCSTYACIKQSLSVFWNPFEIWKQNKSPSCFSTVRKLMQDVPCEGGYLLSAREEITLEPNRNSSSNAPLCRRGPARWMLGAMLLDGTAPSSVPAARCVPLWQDQRLTPERAKKCRADISIQTRCICIDFNEQHNTARQIYQKQVAEQNQTGKDLSIHVLTKKTNSSIQHWRSLFAINKASHPQNKSCFRQGTKQVKWM